MENAIRMAVNGQYTEFSNTIKSELKHKMASHDITKNYTRQYNQYQNLKNKFSEISDMVSPKEEE